MPSFTSEDLRDWRKRLQLTQQQAANHLLMKLSTYRGWERKRNPPPVAALACTHLEYQITRLHLPGVREMLAEHVGNTVGEAVAVLLQKRIL